MLCLGWINIPEKSLTIECAKILTTLDPTRLALYQGKKAINGYLYPLMKMSTFIRLNIFFKKY